MFFETTSIFLNLTEILLWLTFLTYSIFSFEKSTQFLGKKTSTILLLFLTINIATSFLSKDIALSLFFSFKIFEGIIFAWLIIQAILSKKEIGYILVFLGLFEGSLAIGQFFLQHDLGLHLLGEPALNQEILGVAKMNIGTEKLIRGYGNFAHPNILASFFVIIFFYLDYLKWDKFKYFFLIPLFFTFSRSAFLAVFLGLILKALLTKEKFKKTIGALIVILIFSGILFFFYPERFTLDHAFFERLDLIKTSWEIFWANPLGIGNANFLLKIQEFSPNILKPWEFQPVHNLYLLILNENGIFGFLTFLSLIFSILISLFYKNKTLLPLLSAVLILGFADHYFWDIDSGRWLFWMTLGFIFYTTKSKTTQ